MYNFPEDMKKAYESSPLSFVYYQNIDHKAEQCSCQEDLPKIRD